MRQIFIFSLFCIFFGGHGKELATCLNSYSNLAIAGNDLQNVSGSSSSCCQVCQQTQNCRAYTWDGTNGGTCWLKSDTYPLYQASNAFTGIMSANENEQYSLYKSFDYTNFFGFNQFSQFYHWSDPSGGFVNYTDLDTANKSGLIGTKNNKVYIAVDNTTILPANSSYGRNSVRAQTWYMYNSGLFILNVDHVPTGSGIWPAFWLYGEDWPANGEIDVVDAISEDSFAHMGIRTGENCTMQVNSSAYFTGTWDINWYNGLPATTCTTGPFNNGTFSQTIGGCGVLSPNGSFFEPFNQAGGGVVALEWDRERYIRMWNFKRPNIPADIQSIPGNTNPNPALWGMPTVYFPIGPDCGPNGFNNVSITINTDLCGWAGQDFTGGENGCEDNVRFRPESFSEAYWLINYMNIYCKPGTPCPSHL